MQANEKVLQGKLQLREKEIQLRKADKAGDKALEKKLDELGTKDKTELKSVKTQIEEMDEILALKTEKLKSQ